MCFVISDEGSFPRKTEAVILARNSSPEPEEYQDWFIQGDFSGWLRAFKFNEENELTDVEYWNEYTKQMNEQCDQTGTDFCLKVILILQLLSYYIFNILFVCVARQTILILELL